MAGVCAQCREHPSCRVDADRARQHDRVGRHPYEAALRDRTRRPSRGALRFEPRAHRRMVHVRVPSQRDKRVDVQQRHRGAQSSSSARRTISDVIGGVPAGTRMTGSPSSASTRAGVSPRRASSEITEPSERCSPRASCRATTTTSSSMFKVVRTKRCYRIIASPIIPSPPLAYRRAPPDRKHPRARDHVRVPRSAAPPPHPARRSPQPPTGLG